MNVAASSIGIGLVIAMAVSMLADVSGAHFNPAVTCALTAAGELRIADASAYIFSQCAGAFFAAGLASFLAGGVSVPAAPAGFGAEVALTAALVFGCLAVGDWAVSLAALNSGYTALTRVGHGTEGEPPATTRRPVAPPCALLSSTRRAAS